MAASGAALTAVPGAPAGSRWERSGQLGDVGSLCSARGSELVTHTRLLGPWAPTAGSVTGAAE